LYKEQLVTALNINVPSEPDDISACVYKLNGVTSRITNEFSLDIKPVEDRITEYYIHMDDEKKITAAGKNYPRKKRK